MSKTGEFWGANKQPQHNWAEEKNKTKQTGIPNLTKWQKRLATQNTLAEKRGKHKYI